jgi:hypothetical protein
MKGPDAPTAKSKLNAKFWQYASWLREDRGYSSDQVDALIARHREITFPDGVPEKTPRRPRKAKAKPGAPRRRLDGSEASSADLYRQWLAQRELAME